MSLSLRRVSLCLLLLGLACGSDTVVGQATFAGAESKDVTVQLTSAGSVRFDTAVEVDLAVADDASLTDEWQYTIETVRDGVVTATTTCDAFDLGPSFNSSQSGHRLTLSRSRLNGCSVPLPAGVSVLRIRLAPMRDGSRVTPVHVELAVFG